MTGYGSVDRDRTGLKAAKGASASEGDQGRSPRDQKKSRTRFRYGDREEPSLERDAGGASAPSRRDLSDDGTLDMERPGGVAEDGIRGGAQHALLQSDVVADERFSEGGSRRAEQRRDEERRERQ